MKLEIDLVAERRYQASVLGSVTLSPTPIGPEAYFVVIDGLFRMPIETKEAEALLKHMRYKARVENSPGLSQAADRFRQTHGVAAEYAKAAYPPEANIYKASESDPIPDPPSDDDDEDDDEDGDDGFAGTDDAGDGIGQY